MHICRFVKQYSVEDPKVEILPVAESILAATSDIEMPRNPSDCSICPGASLPDMVTFKQHFKSAWHLYNLNLQMKNRIAVTAEQYDCMEVETKTSISSESDEEFEETPIVVGSPFIRFTVSTTKPKPWSCSSPGAAHSLSFSIYKAAVLTEEECSNRVFVLDFGSLRARLLNEGRSRWAIFLIRAGRVAAGIFDNSTGHAILTKTFKRYTTRRKQGGAQSAKDSSRKGIRSAGANIRRRNEQHLIEDVQELIAAWKDDLNGCSRLFWNRTETARHCLFTERASVSAQSRRYFISAADPRWRGIPLSTRTPSLEELLRCYSILSDIPSNGWDMGGKEALPVVALHG